MIQAQREIRFGMIALVIAGISFTVSPIVRGPLPADAAAAMQHMVPAPGYMPSVIIGLIGLVLAVYGQFGLYRYLTLRSDSLIPFLAILFSPLALVFVVPLMVFFAVNVPVIAQLYQQGNQEVLAVYKASFSSPFGLGILASTSLAGLAGNFLFAISIWRDGTLSKWVAVAWPVKNVLLIIFSGPGFYATEILGGVMMLVLSCVIAWKVWRVPLVEHAGTRALKADMAPAVTP